MRAVQALNAVSCTDTELYSVRLLASWAEVARLTIRAVSTRRADITLRVRCVCCPTCFASHACSTCCTGPAVTVLVKLVGIVAHQALCLVGRRCRSTRASLTHALPARMSVCTIETVSVHRIRLFAVRAGIARDAIRTVLANCGAVARHLIHTWIAYTPASRSTKRTRCTAIVCGGGLGAVGTHITVHKVTGEASISCAGRVNSIGACLARDSSNAVSTSCAKLARCAVGARSSTGVAVYACTARASRASCTEHTRSRLGCVVGLLPIKTRTACAVTASRADSASLAASLDLIWFRTRRTDGTHASESCGARGTCLARQSSFRRL